MTISALSKNWLTLKRPTEYFLVSLAGNAATFRIEPLERGFGITLGNALRRIMLSSLQGTAIVAVKIEGGEHEYSTLRGVREDVVDIILNLKSVIIKAEINERKRLKLRAKGAGPIKAGMIDTPPGIEIVNHDLVICHLENDTEFNMDIYIDSGKGYIPADAHVGFDQHLGIIQIDAIFSPVTRCTFRVENSRIGAETEFDRLYLTIETNGSMAPDMALSLAAKIMQEQLRVFISFDDSDSNKDSEETKLPFDPRLLTRIENLELSVRSQNCLKNENTIYVGDLVVKTEAKMLQMPNFGKKSLNEIKDLLAKMNMRFGMEVQGWPPENVEELAKKYEEEGS